MRRPSIYIAILLLWALSATALALKGMSVPTAKAQAGPGPGPGQLFNANGVALWYEVRGEAPAAPLVVVNGGPGFDHAYLKSSNVWDRLAEGRRVVFYDQRGTGRSASWKPEASHSLLDYVADLEALRAQIAAEKIDLVGHSWGGYLSMAYAVRYPDRVQSLVLCDSAAPKLGDTLFLFKSLFPDIMERHERLQVLQSLGDEGAGKQGMQEIVSTLFVSPEKRDEFLGQLHTFHFSFQVNQAVEADLANRDLGPALAGLKLRALVVSGRYDANVGPQTAWNLHKAIPGSRIHFFEKSGHFPFIEEPDQFFQVVEGFLKGP